MTISNAHIFIYDWKCPTLKLNNQIIWFELDSFHIIVVINRAER